LRKFKHFVLYSLIVGAAFALAAVVIHLLVAREYRLNVAERLTIIAHNGEEAVERSPRGVQLEAALARALHASDEGLLWQDAHGRTVAQSGMTATGNAVVERMRVDDEGASGWLQATISNDRVVNAIGQLDLGLSFGIAIAMLSGGLIFAWVSERSIARVEATLQRVHRFTADAAHELRTPLAVISGNADPLAFGDDETKRERSLANIRHAAAQMRTLMNDLLMLARADEGVTGDLQAIDVGTCIETVAASYRSEAAGREVRLSVRSSAPLTVYGRSEQVARIVGNLIENALRYTPPKGTIDVTWWGDRRSAVIEVADSGIGIAFENLERIFDRFWRADDARPGEGSGLGLAIARGLARAHGGDVAVRSRPGMGSTFTIRLPLRPQRSAALSTSS